MTESNYRDFPWMAVNGDRFVITHSKSGTTDEPVATVLSVGALENGDQHPPYFSYYSKDVGGIPVLLPPTHYQNADGLTFLLGTSGEGGKTVNIFALLQTKDPWTPPPLLSTSLTLGESASVFNAVYPAGKLYLIGNKLVEGDGWKKPGPDRYSVRVVRIPIEQTSDTSISASTSAAKGYLDRFFGRDTLGDPSGSGISYEKPALAVNKNGDMLFAYGRYPFSSATPNPEARYSVWYANEEKQRPSYLLMAGEAANSVSIAVALDYETAVVDLSDDKTFWMALSYAVSGGYKTVIGKVGP
jgi:hypothetical protein